MPASPVNPGRLPEHTLLCERCGYVIERLEPDQPCPECATPIAQSLPARRLGSPWQKADAPGAGDALTTALAMIRRPLAVLDSVRLDTHRMERLFREMVFLGAYLYATVLFALALLAGALWATGAGPDWIGAAPLILARASVGIFIAIVAWPLCRGLASIEMRGLRFIGARHGYRITGRIARVVCAHGAIGWGLAVLAIGLGTLGLAIADGLARHGSAGAPAARTIGIWTMIAGSVIGLLTFETLAYTGMRRLRFANMPEEHRPRDGDETPENPDIDAHQT